MYLGGHVGALQQAGIPLRQVINEGNHRTWKQPSDREGLWETGFGESRPDMLTSWWPCDGDPVARLDKTKPCLYWS